MTFGRCDVLSTMTFGRLRHIVKNSSNYVEIRRILVETEPVLNFGFVPSTSVTMINNRGNKHDFPFINSRKVPREVLKTEGEVFNHPKDHANANE